MSITLLFLCWDCRQHVVNQCVDWYELLQHLAVSRITRVKITTVNCGAMSVCGYSGMSVQSNR